ncbi:hypothetical protein ACWG0P_13920 [Amedibacillus sp. YH-ame6]
MENKEIINPEFVLFLKTGTDTACQVVMDDEDKLILQTTICALFKNKNIKVYKEMNISYERK